MPSLNTQLQDEAIDHAVDFERYKTHVVRRMMAVLNRTDDAIGAQLTVALMKLDRESFTVERLEALLGSVRALNAQAFAAVFEELRPEMRELASFEAEYQAATLRATMPAVVQIRFPIAGVSVEQIYAAALSRPFQGRLLADWAANVEASRLVQIRNAVRAGYVEGRTTAEIIRTIKGTKALRYADGLLDRSRRELATVVQTALSHTAQTARGAFVDANLDLVKALKWTSTLDGQTSPMCRVRDGLQYAADGKHAPIGHKIPWLGGPGRLHFNCRSVSVPVTKSWKELGIDVADMPEGTRASMDGQVPADLKYGSWLAKQSAERQDEILGPVRAAMLRNGAPMTKFHDDKGRWLTLAQLRTKHGLTRP